jgi:putative NADH-flavin reductase
MPMERSVAQEWLAGAVPETTVRSARAITNYLAPQIAAYFSPPILIEPNVRTGKFRQGRDSLM